MGLRADLNKKSVTPAQIHTPDHPAHSAVTLLITIYIQYITSGNFFYTGSNNEHRIFNHTAVQRVCPFTVVASMLVWE